MVLRTRVGCLALGLLASIAELQVDETHLLTVAEAHAQFSPDGRKRARSPAPRRAPAAPSGDRGSQPSASSHAERPSETSRFPDGLYASLLENPGEPRLLMKLIEAARALDPELTELTKRLEAETQRSDKGRAYSAMIALGRLELARGSREGARRWYEKAEAAAPERIHAYVALAELGSETDALTALETALPRVTGPDRIQLVLRLRALSLASGDDVRTSRFQAELARLDPKRAVELGELYLERGEGPKAVRAFQEAQAHVRGAGDSARLWLGLGRAHLATEQLELAAVDLAQARSLGARDETISREAALLEIEVAKARGQLTELARRELGTSRDWRVLSRLAAAFEESGDQTGAREVHLRLLSRAPAQAEVWRGYAEFLARLGELREARSAYRTLLTLASYDLQAWTRVLELSALLGEMDRYQEDLEMALSRVSRVEDKLAILDLCLTSVASSVCGQLEKKLVAQSRERALLFELGRRLFLAGDSALARDAWLKGRGASANGEVWSEYGDLLLDHEIVDEGLAAHDRARALSPSDAKIRRARALGLERTLTVGDPARQAERRASALSAWLELARDSSLVSRDREEAARHVVRLWRRMATIEAETERLRERYEAAPSDRINADLYLAALALLGRSEEEKQVLEALARSAPFDPALRSRLLGPREGEGQSAVEGSFDMLAVVERTALERTLRETATTALTRGQYGEALGALDQLKELRARDVTVLLLRAEALERLGRRSEAGENVEAALRLEPRNSAVLMRKAELLVQEGRTREAAQLYLRVIRNSKGPDELALATDALILLRAKEGASDVSVLLAIEEPTVQALSSRPGHPGYRALLLSLYDSLFAPSNFPQERVAQEVEDGLAGARERAKMPLLSILRSGSEPEQAHAARLLVWIGGPASGRALLDYALSGAPDDLVCPVLETLGAKGDEDTLRAIVSALEHEEDWAPRLVMSLAFALARSSSSELTPALVSLTRSPSAQVQTLAWLGLGARHWKGPAPVGSSPRAPLAQASQRLALALASGPPDELNSSPALVRGAALLARSLRAKAMNITPEEDPALRASLAEELTDSDPLLRSAAARGLAVWGGDPFGPWLPETLCSPNVNLEDWVGEVITRSEGLERIQWSSLGPELTRVFSARLRGSKAEQAGALALLSESGNAAGGPIPAEVRLSLSRELVPELDDLLVSGEVAIRAEVLSILPFPSPKRRAARAALKEMLLGQSTELARLAAELIVKQGDRESIAWLDEFWSKTSSWSLRSSLLRSVRALPAPSPELRDFLRRAERDEARPPREP